VASIDQNAIQVASERNGFIGDHVLGNPQSSVVLIEYGDFQCPGCKSAYPRMKAIVEEYKEQIGFVFRNFPLTTRHPNARAASGAAEAAGLQGKYWEMHDLIYDNQTAWAGLTGTERADAFASYIEQIGGDRTTFTNDISLDTINQKISFDQALGKKATVDSTPSFFLGGVKLPGDIWGDDAKLRAAIDAELSKAGIPLPIR